MAISRRQATVGLLAAASLPALPRVAHGQPSPPEHEEAPEAASEPFAEPTEVTTSRTRFEHVTAPVSVNGAGPFNFLIDTGASGSCVSQALAERLGLASGPSVRLNTLMGSRMRPTVMIDQLDVGTRQRRRVRAPALRLGGMAADGVLGVDWLKGQRLVLGFKQKTMLITRSRRDDGKAGYVVPARRRLGQLTIIDADAGGQRISALVGTGSQDTLCNARMRDLILEAERRSRLAPTRLPVVMETLVGETFQGSQMLAPFLRLGGMQLGNVAIVYADMPIFALWGLDKTPAIVLGLDLLTQFETVSLDYGRSAVTFDAGPTA